MILSDRDIASLITNGKIKIIPFPKEETIQPCSVDLHLGGELKTINGKTIDIKHQSYKLKPHEFILGSTSEYVEVPNDLCCQVEGKSSVARLGLMVHITAGYIDAGYNGNITLELYNVSDKEFELEWGLSICQLIFHTLSSECIRPYGSDGLNNHYQGSDGTVLSRMER